MAINLITTGASFIDEMQLITFRNQFSDDFVEGAKAPVNFSVTANFTVSASFGDSDLNGVFVDVQSYKYARLLHDLPPWLWLCVGVHEVPT